MNFLCLHCFYCLKISRSHTNRLPFAVKINPPTWQKTPPYLLTSKLSGIFWCICILRPPHPYTHHPPTQNPTSKLIFLLLSLYPAHPAWKLADSPDVCLPNHQSDPLSLMPLKSQSCKQLVNAAWHIITAASTDLQAAGWHEGGGTEGKHFHWNSFLFSKLGAWVLLTSLLYSSVYTGRVKEGNLLPAFWKSIFNMVSQKLLL